MKWADRRDKGKKNIKRRGGGGPPVVRKIPYWRKEPTQNNVNYTKPSVFVLGRTYKARITGICETGNAIAYYDGIRVIIDPFQAKVRIGDLVEFKITNMEKLYPIAVLESIVKYANREFPIF